MATILNRTTTFATNGTVTAAGLHNLIDDTSIYAGLITTQTELTTVGTADQILIAVGGVSDTGAPRRATVQNLFEDTLTAGTFVNLSLTGALTYGTATGNRTVSTSATITTGTIPNLTSSTASITLGTIPTLTAGTTTSTAANITNGTVQTLTASTGTITNLSTTLAGDFTISQGTGTLGTTGATLGTYGGATSIPVLAIDAKGRVTTASTSAIASNTGFRNRIINGDMRIDQRNAGASVTFTAQYTVDRWYCEENTDGAMTAQRSATAPSGFSNSLLFTTTTADASLGATQAALVAQFIEGFNTSDLAWGTASAKTITLSFWVRSSLTGTFGGALRNSAANRSYPFTYSISVADTWENKTITVAGDTSGTWLDNNGVGIGVFFGLGVGSTNSGTAGAWAGSNFLSATGAVSVIGTLNATFYITGVQLEAGSTATDFERRPIGTELALCQRYYEIASGSFRSATTGSFVGAHVGFKEQKRSVPTMTYLANGGTQSSGTFDAFYGTNVHGAGAQFNAGGDNYGYGFTASASSEL